MALQHAEQHGRDAAERASRTYVEGWHPLLAAREVEPGHWVMVDPHERAYGDIRFVRRGSEVGYRAVTWAEQSADRELIGYYRTLRAAAKATHSLFVRSHVPAEPRRGELRTR